MISTGFENPLKIAISSVNKFSKIKRISVGFLVGKPLSCYKHSLNFVK